MPTWKDVTTIGLALPKTEVSTWYGTPGMKVAGKGFLRLRTEAEGGLVVLEEHEQHVAGGCRLDARGVLHLHRGEAQTVADSLQQIGRARHGHALRGNSGRGR